MDVRPLDPRNTRWEISSPSYRVFFWTRPSTPPGISEDRVMYHSTEFEVSGAEDVGEVLAWAESTAPPGSTFTLYVVLERDEERGLVRLSGVDPTAPRN
jgi:hypothetical protein